MTQHNDEVLRKAQLNYRFGEGHLLNLYAGGIEELNYLTVQATEGEFISNATALGALLNGASVVAGTPTPAAPPAPAYGAPAAPAGPPQPAGWNPGPPGVPGPPRPAPSAGPQAPTCPHGTRKFISKVGPKGPWAAYMCPAAKEDPSKCEPLWQKA